MYTPMRIGVYININSVYFINSTSNMIGLILGNIMVVLGVFSIIKGKLPLIKRYNGVKNIKLHSRIEGTAILLVGIMLIFQCFISLGNVEIVIIILSICIFSLILEIALKVI